MHRADCIKMAEVATYPGSVVREMEEGVMRMWKCGTKGGREGEGRRVRERERERDREEGREGRREGGRKREMEGEGEREGGWKLLLYLPL